MNVAWLDVAESVAVIIASIIAGASLIFMARSSRQERLSASFQMAKSIKDEEREIHKLRAALPRDIFDQLLDQAHAMPVTCGDDLVQLYGRAEYAGLREVGFFYEFLGLMVRRGAVPFDIAFELFYFPEGFWREAQSFLTYARIYCPDFWENMSYLADLYSEKERGLWGRDTLGPVNQCGR